MTTLAKTPSAFPCTPKPQRGDPAGSPPRSALPPARQRGCIRQAVPARPRRAPGQITANPRQIWNSGGKTTVNGRQVGSRQPQHRAGQSEAAPRPPQDDPLGTDPPVCLFGQDPAVGPSFPKLGGLSSWAEPHSPARPSPRAWGDRAVPGRWVLALTPPLPPTAHPNTSQSSPAAGGSGGPSGARHREFGQAPDTGAKMLPKDRRTDGQTRFWLRQRPLPVFSCPRGQGRRMVPTPRDYRDGMHRAPGGHPPA